MPLMLSAQSDRFIFLVVEYLLPEEEDTKMTDIEEYIEADCFDARRARELAEAGITPEQAGTETDDSVGMGGYRATLGYKYANGDMSCRT